MDLLIFDMDGVLIDVSRSYRETIQQTVQIYLGTCLGIETRSAKPVTKEAISLFKSAGGFNNDWDLTSAFLHLILSTCGLPPSLRRKRFSAIEAAASDLRRRSSRLQKSIQRLNLRKNLPPFIRKVRLAGGGLEGVRRTLKGSWKGWVYADGDLDQENVVKRIFQEVYLGDRFNACYHLPRLFYKGKGLYLREKLIIPRRILSTLRKRCRLGIASGRPRFEAELALKRFGLLPYFDSVVTLDECLEEETRILQSTGKRIHLLKPHPYALLRVAKEIGLPNPRCGYVGDVVDDMLAARAARKELDILPIGFLRGGRKNLKARASILKAGARVIVETPRGLLEVSTLERY